jgi:hypothetical protein
MTATPCEGVVRLDERKQRLPRNNLIHLGEELLAASTLAIAVILRVAEAHLTHR